jgi:RNA polymerase sigma-70 factor (ECF subfamily)
MGFSRQPEWLAQTLEAKRVPLRAFANGIRRCRTDADDALQDAGLWLSRSNADEIGNPGGWLTTVVAQIYPDILRFRIAKREKA